MASKRYLKRLIADLDERVENLEAQLSENFVEREVPDNSLRALSLAFNSPYPYDYHRYRTPTKTIHELTTEGKISAIAEYLGLNIEVEQKKTTTTGPKIKTTKAKKGKK
jgi:hypothetical protein